VGCFWEILNLNDEARGKHFGINYEESDDPYQYAQKYVWGNSTLPAIRGFKDFYYQCANKAEFWLKLKQSPDIKVIHLTRQNLFLRYLSLERAKATGVWHPDNKSRRKYLETGVSLKIDTRHLVKSIDDLLKREQSFRSSVDKTILEVTYEGMATGNDVELCCKYLGLTASPAILEFAKSAVNSDVMTIENDREVLEVLSSGGYGHWYEEFCRHRGGG